MAVHARGAMSREPDGIWSLRRHLRTPMASNDEFKHDSVQDRTSIANYLRALLEGFEKGHLELGTAGQSFVLDPEGLLELEVRAKRKSGRCKLSLKVSWREGEEDNGSDELTIKVD